MEDLLTECRRLKREYCAEWLGETGEAAWSPRCEVVLHATRASYLAAVGRGGGMSRGSSVVEFQRDQIIRRRIDLLLDDDRQAAALGHELMHVVLADHFGRTPPRWVDEGLATLADPVDKRRRHSADLDHAIRTNGEFSVVELMHLNQIRTSQQAAVFYGQSLSLVQFLVSRHGAEEFLPFVRTAIEHGYDRALRTSYKIDGIVHLERLWRRHVQQERDGQQSLAIDAAVRK